MRGTGRGRPPRGAAGRGRRGCRRVAPPVAPRPTAPAGDSLVGRAAYDRPVEPAPGEICYHAIRGHSIEVVESGDGGWRVAVDGEALGSTFADRASAWAAGAAEGYRRTPAAEARRLAVRACRLAARLRLESPMA